MSPLILIVDDEFGLAEVISELLSDEGYRTALAPNGKLGLMKLAESRPGLVLLDVMMPVLDGPGMLRAMRADPAYADLPVVIMTSLPDYGASGSTAPAHQALLRKPFAPDALLAVVRRFAPLGG